MIAKVNEEVSHTRTSHTQYESSVHKQNMVYNESWVT